MLNLHQHKPVHAIIALGLLAAMPVFGLATARYPYEPTPFRDLTLPVLVVELSLIVLLSLSCKESILNRLGRIRKSTWVLAILWLIFITSSTILATHNPPDARYHLTLTVIYVAFAWLVFDEIRHHTHFGSLLLESIAVGLAFFGAIVIVFAQMVEVSDKTFWSSLDVGFTNIRHFGYYANILFCLSAGLYLSTNKPTASRLWALAVGLSLLFVYWSGSRGAFISIHGTFVFYLVLVEKTQRIRLAKLILAGSIIAIPIAYALAPDSELYGPQNIFFRIQSIETGINDYSSGRVEIWMQTLRFIADQPLLRYGETQFRWTVELAKNQYKYPHNIVLPPLFQWGFVGTLLLIAWVLSALRINQWGMSMGKAQLLPATGLVFGISTLSLIDGPLFYIFPIMAVLTCLAILAVAISPGEESPHQHA